VVGISEFLKTRRNKVLDVNASMTSFFNQYFSGTTYSQWRKCRDITKQYSSGIVLDAGCGRGGWRDYILQNAERRESLDWTAREGETLDWEADLTDMPEVPSGRFDAIICHQVFEHISEPRKAFGELYRVMKPGGFFVISVPHLSRLHELPYDFYRYTPQGLSVIAEQCGFEVKQLQTYGGIATFIHHQFSTVFIGLASVTNVTGKAAGLINAPFAVLSTGIDAIMDRKALLPNGIIAVLQKPF